MQKKVKSSLAGVFGFGTCFFGRSFSLSLYQETELVRIRNFFQGLKQIRKKIGNTDWPFLKEQEESRNKSNE